MQNISIALAPYLTGKDLALSHPKPSKDQTLRERQG